MSSIDDQFRRFLPQKLGQHYDQLMRARSGLAVDLQSFDITGEYGQTISRDGEIPESFIAIRYNGDRPLVKEPSKCFQHLVDLKTLLGPKFPWYDPAKPSRPGFFVAGSFATPCWEYLVKETSVWSIDDNGKGFEHTFDFHVPKGRGDVDLFIAGSGDVVDMAAESLVHGVMTPSEKNPFIRRHPIVVCEIDNCQAHFRKNVQGSVKYEGKNTKFVCNKCITNNNLPRDHTYRDVYSYLSKHLVAFDMCPLKIEVVTRVYSTPEKCPALFDLTYDGGIYMGGDSVRFLDIALYQHDNQILLTTPFSGSSTQELRHLKKIEAYGLDLVVPGLRWDADMASQDRGLTVVRDVLNYRSFVKNDIVAANIDVATKRLYRCIMKFKSKGLKAITNHFLDIINTTTYSFVPGCTGLRVDFVNHLGLVVGPIVLVDIPGCDIHVGAFSFTPPADFVRLWCMDIRVAPLPNPTLPPPYELNAQTLRRASKGFSFKVRNLITSFDIGAVIGAKRVVLAPGLGGILAQESIDVGFTFEIIGVEGAQIWNLDFSGSGAPVIRCKSTTGLYSTGDSVCMGSQTHYHDTGLPFSLSAMVTSLAERPALIIGGDVEHVKSVGVLDIIADVDTIVKAHTETLNALEDDRWILRFQVPEQ